MAQYEYSSIQLNLPANMTKIFTQFSNNIIPTRLLYNKDEYGFPDIKHITILYGIHSAIPTQEVIQLINNYPTFKVVLKKVSLFKGDEFDVVKLDIMCPDLDVLNSELKEVTEYTSNFPKYIPHSTIAYVQPNTCDYLNGLDYLSGLSFMVKSLWFSSYNNDHINISLNKVM